MTTNKDKLGSEKKFPKKDINLSTDNTETPTNQCELPFIPIYPVRYGLTSDYINKVKGKGSNEPIVEEIPDPTGMMSNHIHHLQQLRQGFIYIYAHTEHRQIATDKKGKWMVFRYATNVCDANSASELPYINVKSHSFNPSFFLYSWADEGAEGNWERLESREYDTLFVDKDVQYIDIAYSEYPWPAKLFDNLENSSAMRQSIMTTVDIDKHDQITTNSSPIEKLNELVIEFSGKNNLLEESKEWHTCIKNNHKDDINLIGERGIIVALKDTLGEMQELQECHAILAKKQEQYYKEHTYPLTIGEIIHPKLGHELRGINYKGKEETLFEKEKIKKYLNTHFESTYKKLVKDGIDNHEKPIKETVKMIVHLAKRKSLNDYLMALKDTVSQPQSNEQINIASYSLLGTLSGAFYSLEASQEGEKVTRSALGEKLKPKDEPFNLGKWAELIQEVLTSVSVIKQRLDKPSNSAFFLQKILGGFFQGMELMYFNAGRVLAKQWFLNRKSTVLPPKLLLSLYGLGEVAKDPGLFFPALIEEVLTSEKGKYVYGKPGGSYRDAKEKGKMVKKDLRRYLAELKKEMKDKSKTIIASIEQEKIREEKRRKEQIKKWNKFHHFVGVVGLFSGLVSLNSDDALQRKLAQTSSGKLAYNRILVKSAALLDISLASTGIVSRLGYLNLSEKIIVPAGAKRVSLQTVGANVRSLAFLGLGVISGVIGMVIANGEVHEAKIYEDEVAQWGYRVISFSAFIFIAAPLFSFAAKLKNLDCKQ